MISHLSIFRFFLYLPTLPYQNQKLSNETNQKEFEENQKVLQKKKQLKMYLKQKTFFPLVCEP